jgi:tryptophan-rich sensory protein
MKKKVKINTASYDEIRALKYLKDSVAQKIVDERELNGPFGSPSELSRRVKGLDVLSGMLSSYIDWEIPVPPEPPKERRWWRIVLWAALIFLLPAVVIYPPFAKLSRTLDRLKPFMTGSIRRSLILGAAGVIISLFLVEALFIIQIVQDFTRSVKMERRWATYGYTLFIVGALFIFVLMGAVAVLAPREVLAAYPSYTSYVFSIMMIPLFMLLFYGLPLYARNRPELIDSRLLGGAYGVALVFGLPLLMVVGHLTLRGLELPLAFYVLQILLGLVIIYRLYQMLRDRSWYFSQVAGSLSPSIDLEERKRSEELLEWLNHEWPNDSDQRALARALVGKYPAVRKPSFAGVTFAAGIVWFIIAKGGEAIYEQIVQGWAEPYLQAIKKLFE